LFPIEREGCLPQADAAVATARSTSPPKARRSRGVRLEIEEVPVAVFCPVRNEERTLPGIQDFRCPVCGAPTPDVVRGRELELATMEVSAREEEKNATPDR
jgi:ribosomal protein L34E